MPRNQCPGVKSGVVPYTHPGPKQCRSVARTFRIVAWSALLLAALPGLGQTATPTKIALAVNPASAAYGSAFTFVATVAQTGSTHPLRGSVTFTDTVGTTSRVLGVAQVQSAAGIQGAAVLVQRLGTIGNHSITASFSPTAYFSGITSAAQTVAVSGHYPTTTSITGTSGSAGNWSLQATVVGLGSLTLAPTGSVSLQDTSNGNYLLGTSTLGSGSIARTAAAGAGSPIAVGNAPSSVAVGDFNDDGFMDIAVLNSGDSTISVLLGNGTGGFTLATKTPPASGANAVAIAAADLDGDGNVDLLVTNSTSNTITILPGKGDGTFKTAKVSTLASSAGGAYALALGDFNGDGILDVAALNNASQVNIILGDGAGGFAVNSGSPFSVGSGATSITAGDFNGDGFLDFVTANPGASSITVMRGDGTANNFVSSTINLANGSSPTGIVADYFDANTTLDLAVTEANSSNVAVLLGNGDMTFGTATTYSTGSTPVSVISGDFNGDGFRDLVVANKSGNTLTVLLGTGTGTFAVQSPAIPTGGNSPSAFAIADFNGDGTVDIAVANTAGNNLGVLLNQIADTASVSFSAISIPGSGNHAVAATYNNDKNFAASTSGTVLLGATLIPTTTTLTSSQSSAGYGQQIVLTATVTPNPVGNLTPANGDLVTFKDGTSVLGTGTLTSGTATLNVTSLTLGSHPSLTAVFAGDTNFQTSTSAAAQPVTISPGTPTITWNAPASIPFGAVVGYAPLNATATSNGATVAGTYAYTPVAGTVPGVGPHTLSVTFTPGSSSYTSTTSTTTIQVTQATPVITWPIPASITYGTPLDVVQLNATATNTTQVPLSSYYNITGITVDKASFSGGFDGGGNAYSSNSLGSAIVWNGVSYTLGQPDQLDGVSAVTSAIPVPAGYYTGVTMLGAMVNNSGTAYTVQLNYADGTNSGPLPLNMSDWVYPQGFADESVIKCNIARDTSGGGTDTHSTCLYGYTIAADSTKVLVSVLLPQSRQAAFLAMGVVSPPVLGTFAYTPASGAVLTAGAQTLSTVFIPTDTTDYTTASASVPLTVTKATPTLVWPTPASITYGTPLSTIQLNAVPTAYTGMVFPSISAFYRTSAIFNDGQAFSVNGFGNTSTAYSANLLPTSIVWSGITFPLGPANLPDALTSSTILMPQSNFYTLYLLAAANGNQTGQQFMVNYTDGTSVPATFSISSWTSSQSYTGESVAASTTYLNTSGGGKNTTTNYIYGYQVTLDPTKILKSITLPNNQNVVILSMALSTTLNPASTAPVQGVTTYTPPSGTILPVGLNPLAASFVPTDTKDYNSATGSNSILVTKIAGEIISLTSNNNPAFPASSVTFTVTLPSTATGTVQLMDGTALLGTSITLSSGVATYTTSALANGTHSITAVYSGDTTYTTVTSSALSQVVGKGTATVAISGAPNASTYLQSVKITITVTGVSGTVPTGTVTLYDAFTSTQLGPAITLTSGTATYSTTTLVEGHHDITATYSGDSNYN